MQFKITDQDGRTSHVEADVAELLGPSLVLSTNTNSAGRAMTPSAIYHPDRWSNCVATDVELFSPSEVADRIAVVLEGVRGEIEGALIGTLSDDSRGKLLSIIDDRLEGLDA